HVRVVAQERLEVPGGDGLQGDVGLSSDGRAATLVVEQRHLSERVPRSERPGLARDRAHAGPSRRDDHEPDPSVAGQRDLVPRRLSDVVVDWLTAYGRFGRK